MDADQPPETSAESLLWVRKRDGGVAAFDAGRLASSILAAHERVDPENPAFEAQELTRAVLHFLVESSSGPIPTTEEISDTVVKVLREMGHAATAREYLDYGAKRARLRAGDGAGQGDVGEARPFDKSSVAERLELELELDASTAREMAAAVEKKVLSLGLRDVSAGLIEELIAADLHERGIDHRWLGRGEEEWTPRRLSAALDAADRPDDALVEVGRLMLRRYSLSEILTRDVAGLVREGVLRIPTHVSPIHWSSLTVGVLEGDRRPGSLAEALEELESRLNDRVERVSSTIVVEGLDANLALLLAGDVSPSTAAEKVAAVLLRARRQGRARIVVNVYGQVPLEMSAAGTGDLFDDAPTDRHDQWAGDFAHYLGGALAPAVGRCDGLRVDVHLDALWPDEKIAAVAERWVRRSHRGLAVDFVFDRPTWTSGEGFVGLPGPVRGIVEYVGLDLGVIVDRLGGPDDAELLAHRLDLAADSAIRLGVQKREYLRERTRGLSVHRGGGVVLCPLGFEAWLDRVGLAAGWDDETSLAVADRLLRRLVHRSFREAQRYGLDCAWDTIPSQEATREIHVPAGRWKIKDLLGRLISAGRLQGALHGGRTCVRLVELPRAVDVARLVVHAAKETSTGRLTISSPLPDRQPTLFD